MSDLSDPDMVAEQARQREKVLRAEEKRERKKVFLNRQWTRPAKMRREEHAALVRAAFGENPPAEFVEPSDSYGSTAWLTAKQLAKIKRLVKEMQDAAVHANDQG